MTPNFASGRVHFKLALNNQPKKQDFTQCSQHFFGADIDEQSKHNQHDDFFNSIPYTHDFDRRTENPLLQKKRNEIRESEGKKGDSIIGAESNNHLEQIQIQMPESELNNNLIKPSFKLKCLSQKQKVPDCQDYGYFSKGLEQSVGVLRASWKNSQGRETIINYGTAFAISPRLVITCQHNIFYEKCHLSASQILFAPGVNGRIAPSSKVWKSTGQQFYRAKEIKRFQQTFSIKPLINQLCLIVLQEPLPLTKYVKVACLKLQPLQQIELIGYPSQSYSKQINIFAATPQRSHLTGKIVQVVDEITLVHNMPTKVGNSGSPIVARNSDNEVVVIGIHTHRGFSSVTNNGLFFSSAVLRMLRRFQQQLKEIHSLEDAVFSNDDKWNWLQGCQLVTPPKDSNIQIMDNGSEQKGSEMENLSIISGYSQNQSQEQQDQVEASYCCLDEGLQMQKRVLEVGKHEAAPAGPSDESSRDNFSRFLRNYLINTQEYLKYYQPQAKANGVDTNQK